MYFAWKVTGKKICAIIPALGLHLFSFSKTVTSNTYSSSVAHEKTLNTTFPCGSKENTLPILYVTLPSTGQPESIQVGREFVTLDELGDMLHDSCQNKIIHFGSCKTLSTDTKRIEKFLDDTGALCVCGFETEINFVESSAFDMVLIEMFQQYKDIAMLDKNIRKNYRSFVKRLQFKLIYR